MIIKIFLLLLISISSTYAATFTATGNTGYCAGWGLQGQSPADQTAAQCQAILDPAVENGGACMGSGGNARITPAYKTQAECEDPANGNTCCRNSGCIYPCSWQTLTGDSPYNTIMEPTVCAFCTSSSLSGGSAVQYTAEPSGITPDFYEEFDPESNPIDQPIWNTKDTACGPNKFVTIGATGELECGDCSGSNDPAAFLVEFSTKRDSGTGVKHGKCCINSHHHVCQQLLNSYKMQCTDDDGDKGHLTARTCAA
jgi:hypothetical protein